MSNIKKAFKDKSVIGFIMAGDPNLETTKEIIIAMSNAGADMVELGIPFSDPIAESGIVQNANIRALKSETYLTKIFKVIEEVRKETEISIIFHTYINPVFNFGYEEFFKKCSEVKIDGIVIPDLPYEEKEEIKEYADKYDIAIISFIVPSTKERIQKIAKEATGFIYFAHSIGTTSALEGSSKEVTDVIEFVREATDIPIALGFGINTVQQAEYYSKMADGIILGNGLVKLAGKYEKDSPKYIFDYIKQIKTAINTKREESN